MPVISPANSRVFQEEVSARASAPTWQGDLKLKKPIGSQGGYSVSARKGGWQRWIWRRHP